MRESVQGGGSGVAGLPGLVATLAELSTDCDDTLRIDAIRHLEELKAAAAAAQARMTAAFVASQRQANRSAGVPADRADRGIAHQVGLARRISPFHARRYVGWAAILTSELPATFARLQGGETTEWRAMLVARETGWLTRAHRAALDAELAPRLESLGDRKTEAEAKRIAYRLDPHGYTDRLGTAESDRRVTLRPAPDVMARLTALVPVAQGIAARTALAAAADALRATGDPRSRGQVMADLLVERLTGQSTADAVPVEIHLVLDADTLLGPDTDAAGAVAAVTDGAGAQDVLASAGSAGRGVPAWLSGYGPVPASWARDLARHSGAPRWIRRLYTRPSTGDLVGMDSRRRLFTEGQRRFVTARDQTCRTPWCDAPIRHIDHIVPAETGGATTVGNGQGLCVACNHAKQAPGWQSRPGPDGTISTTTPTGHTYQSRAPDLIHPRRSPLEIQVETWLYHHAA